MSNELVYCLRIRETTPIGEYHDAIYYTPEEYAGKTEADLIADVKTRVDNWIAFVAEQSSKPPVKPTKEELEASKAELLAQVERLDVQIAEAVAIGEAEPVEGEVIP